MGASRERGPSPLGDRIKAALAAEGRTQTSAEAVLVERGVLSKGQLSSLISGRRGTKSVNVEMLGAIADYLHVDFDWLARGRGGMRRGGREATAAETVFAFARTLGIRDDAIDAAWERNKDRADALGAASWFELVQAEALRLNELGAPTPEQQRRAKSYQDKVARAKKKLDKAAEKSPVPPALESKKVIVA